MKTLFIKISPAVVWDAWERDHNAYSFRRLDRAIMILPTMDHNLCVGIL